MADIEKDSSEIDTKNAARRIEEAGVADETAAYVDADTSGDGKGGEVESEAHPS